MRLPWNDLVEENLVVFEQPSLWQQCYCSVMGSLGEMRMIQAYIGPSSYYWFRKVHEGQPVTMADFYAYQHSIFVQYIPIQEVDGPDRELLQVMQHPLAKGTVAPVFRTIRNPGHRPRMCLVGLRSHGQRPGPRPLGSPRCLSPGNPG
jgi:hypothetical protein